MTGSDLTVINSGSITGGLAGDGVTRADAIAFTGGTNILELQAGSAITGNVVAYSTADTLRLGGSTNASFDVSQIGAQYQGFGNFGKVGSSTWTLTGSNSAALSWSVAAGTLDVTGTMANSAMTVASGGTLAGTGTVGMTQINGSGILAPGSGAAGTSLTIAGSLALQSGAIYLVQVNPSAASFASVAGTATLGGAVVRAVFANGSYISKTYTILTAAGGVSGNFASTVVNTNLPSNFHTSLSYDANNAYLNLTLNYAAPTSGTTPSYGSGLTGNQQAVGNALTNVFNSNGGIAAVYGALTPTGLSQASGESTTRSQQTTFNAMGQFMNVMTDSIGGHGNGINGASQAIGYADDDGAGRAPTDAFAMFTKARPAPFAQRWSVWAEGFGGSQSTDGNAAMGSSSTTSSIYGTAVGAEYLVSPDTLAGFSLAGGGTSFSVNGFGWGRSDLFQAGAYMRHTEGAAYVSAALAYGWQDITTDRIVTIAGINHLRAEFEANSYSGRLEGGYRFVAPWNGGLGLTPYAAAQFTTYDLPAYAESVVSGSGAFALAYGAKAPTDARSELGLRSDKSFALPDGVFTLRGRLAWAHDFDPDQSLAATFQSLPGASFVVNGAAQAADSVLTTVSAEMKWMNGWSAMATFEGEFSDVTRSYAGKGLVRYAW